MFLGYQINQNGEEFIASARENREDLENNIFMKFTKIEEVKDDVELVSGKYYIGKEQIKEAQSEAMRKIRDSYLVQYVDSVVSNPLRWADMSAEEQQDYKDYRQYLLNVPQSENFPGFEILTFDLWKKEAKGN